MIKIALLAALLCGPFLAGCGAKGPLELPRRPAPEAAAPQPAAPAGDDNKTEGRSTRP